MAVAGLYRRILPSPPAIEFASSDGKKLFADALQCGTMEGFFKLISYFQTQSEPAYCGLASLSVVLNALAIDPGRKWKGPWRWFDESMLDCCEPLDKVKVEGITLGKVACLANCAGANVEAFRTTQITIDGFRNYVQKCASSEDCHLIASYNRKPFKQTGSGHFSPIGGYHAKSDMALILDVARFKYPPHWVPLSLLWEAMNTIDEATGQHRGFILISKFQNAPSLLYTLSCRHESWVTTAKYLTDDVPLLLESEEPKCVPQVLSLLFGSLPANAADFIKWIAEVRRPEGDSSSFSREEKGRLALKEEVLQQLRGIKLFKLVMEFSSSTSLYCNNLQSPNANDNESISEIAAQVCCQGAELLSGGHGVRRVCCRATCIRCLRFDRDSSQVTVASGTVVSGRSEESLDVLVPVSPLESHEQCCSGKSSSAVEKGCDATMTHPINNDMLTVLLLALPPQTWLRIKDEKLSMEFRSLVSTDDLPDLLRSEVLHLGRQLHFLKSCKDSNATCM